MESNNLNERINMKKEWNEPYTMPESYFDQLQEQIMAKTANKKSTNVRWIWFSAAAAALLIAVGVLFIDTDNAIADNKRIAEAEQVINTTSSLELSEVLAEDVKAQEPTLLSVENNDVGQIPVIEATHTDYEELLLETDLIPVDIEEDLIGEIEI